MILIGNPSLFEVNLRWIFQESGALYVKSIED